MIAIVAVLIAFAAILYTLSVRRKDVPEAAPVSPVAHLEARKAAIYENLRDLQFEYRVGKLSDSDYQQTKQDLQLELAGVLAEIDQGGKSPAPVPAAAAQTAVAAAAMVCSKCGAKFDKPLKFCGECGAAMTGEQS